MKEVKSPKKPLIFYYGIVLLALVLFPLWFLAHCVFRLVQLPYIRLRAGYGCYVAALVFNIVGVVLGLFDDPVSVAVFPVAELCVGQLPHPAGC